VTWVGRYGRVGQPAWEWQPCAVEDVSGGGARLSTLQRCTLRAGDPILISLERLGSTSVGITLRGQVAHVTSGAREDTDPAPSDGCTIGVALDFTTPQERRIAESLFSPS
jgi:hypothetical protein